MSLVRNAHLRRTCQPVAGDFQKRALAADTELGMILFDHGFSFRSIPSSKHLFFQELVLNDSCPILRSRRALACSDCPASAFEPKNLGQALLQFLLPSAHLHGVDPLILSDLADRLDSLQRLQGDSRLELIRFAHPSGSPPDRLCPLRSDSGRWILLFFFTGCWLAMPPPNPTTS